MDGEISASRVSLRGGDILPATYRVRNGVPENGEEDQQAPRRANGERRRDQTPHLLSR